MVEVAGQLYALTTFRLPSYDGYTPGKLSVSTVSIIPRSLIAVQPYAPTDSHHMMSTRRMDSVLTADLSSAVVVHAHGHPTLTTQRVRAGELDTRQIEVRSLTRPSSGLCSSKDSLSLQSSLTASAITAIIVRSSFLGLFRFIIDHYCSR